jgi:hypothetical protein
MFTGSLDLHLAITHTDVVARGVDGGGAGEHAPIAQTEARAMPGTLHHITRQRSLIQWSAR